MNEINLHNRCKREENFASKIKQVKKKPIFYLKDDKKNSLGFGWLASCKYNINNPALYKGSIWHLRLVQLGF